MPLLEIPLRKLLLNVEVDRLVVSKISNHELKHLISLTRLELHHPKLAPLLKKVAQFLELEVDVFQTQLLLHLIYSQFI